MRELYRFELDFNTAKDYFFHQLDGGNLLSKTIVDLLELEQGAFFTLLPKNIEVNKVHQFSLGGILPATSLQKSVINGKSHVWQRIPSISEELSVLISNAIMADNQLFAILEDVLKSSDDPSLKKSRSHNVECLLGSEVYYCISNRNANHTLIKDCIRDTNAFWHFLCVLSSAPYGLKECYQTITEQEIKEICLSARLVIIGAYDSEGYLFWERNSIPRHSDSMKQDIDRGFRAQEQPPVESAQGCWYKSETEEKLYPDLDDSPSMHPHWDYASPEFPDGVRLFLKEPPEMTE